MNQKSEKRKPISLEKTEERKPISLDKEEVTANHSYIDKTTGQRVCKPIGSVGEELYPKRKEQRVAFPQGNICNEDGTPIEQEEPKKQKVVHPTKATGEERVDKSVCSESKKEEKDEENDDNFDNYCDYSISGEPTNKVSNLFLEYIKRRPVGVLTLFVSLVCGLVLYGLDVASILSFLAMLCVACILWSMIFDFMYLFMSPIRELLTYTHKDNLISSVARDLADEQERQNIKTE